MEFFSSFISTFMCLFCALNCTFLLIKSMRFLCPKFRPNEKKAVPTAAAAAVVTARA